MWSMNDTYYWTENELTSFKDVSQIVLNKGWWIQDNDAQNTTSYKRFKKKMF